MVTRSAATLSPEIAFAWFLRFIIYFKHLFTLNLIAYEWSKRRQWLGWKFYWNFIRLMSLLPHWSLTSCVSIKNWAKVVHLVLCTYVGDINITFGRWYEWTDTSVVMVIFRLYSFMVLGFLANDHRGYILIGTMLYVTCHSSNVTYSVSLWRQ